MRQMTIFLMACYFILLISCNRNTEINAYLDDAESIMENYPDSALKVLEKIDYASLSHKEERARYALLKSMALDKNYIDETTFDIL